MFRWSGRIASLFLVPALLVSVSCSTDESAFGPSSEPPSQLLSTVTGLTGTTTTLLGETVNLLTCSAQPYARASKAIGPNGGTITARSPSAATSWSCRGAR